MTIHLRMSAVPTKEPPVCDWESQLYVLSSAVRGTAEPPLDLELKADDVLELELESGLRLLVAAEDAERYLGPAASRSGNDVAELLVSRSLRLQGPHLPDGVTRDGLGSWLLKTLRVFRQGPAGVTALAAAGVIQDHSLSGRRGLYRIRSSQVGKLDFSSVKRMPSQVGPVLLFIHGTASSTEGSFGDLWRYSAYSSLEKSYKDCIYGFEHHTLTESPISNALELLNGLPDGTRLHIVSHSRGGLVGELLARANRYPGDSPAFSKDEIQRFIEHAQRTGRNGFEDDAEKLRELSRRLKRIRVERFVRIAAPLLGTTLASGRLDRWASVMLNLVGGCLFMAGKAVPLLDPLSQGYGLFKRFLLAVVKERTDARVLPGLEAMMPDSPLVALLNEPSVELESSLHVIAGDYRGDSLLSWLGDCLSERFYDGQTDLVVNTPSMAGGAVRRSGGWQKVLAGPQVTHFSYFEREESLAPLLLALAGDDSAFERLPVPSRVPIARGGRKPMAKPGAPIALVLPGIMGSHLAIDRDRIWFDPVNLIAGGMENLRVDARNVKTDGWMDLSYQDFADYLGQSHEVRPFVYDWRRSIVRASDDFGKALDKAMAEATDRRKPLRILAHSLGGLVARLTLKGNDRWTKFKAIPGSRLIQFGTPNQGSYSIAAVLTGRDAFIQKIERWFDWKHDMWEFLDIVRDFPGVLELLPRPDTNRSGKDYFDQRTWDSWAKEDRENRWGRGGSLNYDRARGAGDGWPIPEQVALSDALKTVHAIDAAKLETSHTLYVAGRAERTPADIRFVDGQMEIGWSSRGDGRVLWDTGIPAGVPFWLVEAAHGDLLKHQEAFPAYLDLINTGRCSLPALLPASRGTDQLDYRPSRLDIHSLYPGSEEVLAAALGGSQPTVDVRPKEAEEPARISIRHGSLACAKDPILIGSYVQTSFLQGSGSYLDRLLDGTLSKAQALGRYPVQPGEAMVFLQASPAPGPKGAVVVGLGSVGMLQPGLLTRTLVQGLLEYARVQECQLPDGGESEGETLATLLVGTGESGLSVELGMRCLAEALCSANRLLREARLRVRIACLDLYEEEESRAIIAAETLRELMQEDKFRVHIAFDNRIQQTEGAYLARSSTSVGNNGWHRVMITKGDASSLHFALITERARNTLEVEADQRQAVDSLIRSATGDSQDRPGLSRALFELLIPNGFKSVLADIHGVLLGVDAHSAVYPWELMRSESERVGDPLVVRIGLVRQLASPYGGRRVSTVSKRRLLVVGDTDSGLVELRGAQREARDVARLYQGQGYEVVHLERANGEQLLVNLFDEEYRIIHLAAHGVVAGGDGRGHTGLVLGKNTYLTTAQVSKLRRVPELVFLNCCHLGSMEADARPRWGQLAANLATEFIEMGCKAVVASGWEVDDAAAETFAQAFHQGMLEGKPLGEVLLAARRRTYLRNPTRNTWGAYQAYGDENYRLAESTEQLQPHFDYIHTGQVINDLSRLQASAPLSQGEREEKAWRLQLEGVEAAARTCFFGIGEIRERLGAAWASFAEYDRAIAHYRAALEQPDHSASLGALGQLAELEIRHGRTLERQSDSGLVKIGKQLMDDGIARIEALQSLGGHVNLLVLSLEQKVRRLLDDSGASSDIIAALNEMIIACQSVRGSGDSREDSMLSDLLSAALLLAVWSDDEDSLSRVEGEWAKLPVAWGSGVDRQWQTQAYFSQALALAEANLLRAILAGLKGPQKQALPQTVVEEYEKLFARQGTAWERHKALQWIERLRDLWPCSDGQKDLKDELSNLCEGLSGRFRV